MARHAAWQKATEVQVNELHLVQHSYSSELYSVDTPFVECCMGQAVEEDGSGPGRASWIALCSGSLAPLDTAVLTLPCMLRSDDTFLACIEA